MYAITGFLICFLSGGFIYFLITDKRNEDALITKLIAFIFALVFFAMGLTLILLYYGK